VDLLLAVSLLVAQFLLSVDVLSVLVATTGIVVSYSSLSASILLLFTYFVTRSTSQLSSILGILILVVAFDTASSSAVLSLWLCISSVLLALQIMTSVHLGSIYILMSTVTTCLY
jgi:hypothetical protein